LGEVGSDLSPVGWFRRWLRDRRRIREAERAAVEAWEAEDDREMRRRLQVWLSTHGALDD